MHTQHAIMHAQLAIMNGKADTNLRSENLDISTEVSVLCRVKVKNSVKTSIFIAIHY